METGKGAPGEEQGLGVPVSETVRGGAVEPGRTRQVSVQPR